MKNKDTINKEQEYKLYVQTKVPKPNYIKNCIRAFWVGGTICIIGQIINNSYVYIGLNKEDASTAAVITMIFLGAFLTGLGIYDKLGKYAGAGSIVPITGFANSIVSPAMEYKREGYIFGVAAKMFILAGPVLVYGFTTSVIIGILHYIFTM